MAETDLLGNLLSTNPDEPAKNGVVLLLREMKSEFKAFRGDFGRLEGRQSKLEDRMEALETRMSGLQDGINDIKKSLELIAQQVVRLLEART
jgi:predicted nuclease with TOPRIM domain